MTTATELPALPKAPQTRNLILATWAFAISFWAWNLIGPLAARYATQMDLSATQKSFVVAVPVIVGALGRIAAGTLTDKFGGRLMFTVLLVLSAPFVVLVAVAGNADSYPLLVVFGFFLGIAGTTFAVYFLGIVAERWLQRFSWIGLVVAVIAGLTIGAVVKRRTARLVEDEG
jgi:NNP family nitrate/nitrite transporter-like MFS transporter